VVICKQKKLFLIEDAAQATGSQWRGQTVGTFGDVGCFSFQEDKVLNAGEGGAVATQNMELAGVLFSLHHPSFPQGSPKHTKHEVGTNARLSEWQAAILRCQLQRLDTHIQQRNANATYLLSLLQASDPLRPVFVSPAVTRYSFSALPFFYDPQQMNGLARSVFLKACVAEGLRVWEGHTDPIYRRPLFLENPITFRNQGCPVAEHTAEVSIVLSQRFFLGPGSWMERFVEIMRDIQAKALLLKNVFEHE
jgi:dTDP-4-amino-4,6-dideoxygalactose transaminase